MIEACFDALDLWRKRADCVEGEALDATHYMAEEIPVEITVRMADFFSRHMTDQGSIQWAPSNK